MDESSLKSVRVIYLFIDFFFRKICSSGTKQSWWAFGICWIVCTTQKKGEEKEEVVEKKGWKSMSNYYCRCCYWHHKINFSFTQKLLFILFLLYLFGFGRLNWPHVAMLYLPLTAPFHDTVIVDSGLNMKELFHT